MPFASELAGPVISLNPCWEQRIDENFFVADKQLQEEQTLETDKVFKTLKENRQS